MVCYIFSVNQPQMHNLVKDKDESTADASRPHRKRRRSDNNRVYSFEVHHSVSDPTQIQCDVASNPTLPHTKAVRCAKCQHSEAVFLQATARGEGMTLFFVCCHPNCSHRWREENFRRLRLNQNVTCS